MERPSAPLPPAKVRLIQVARRRLGLADDDYRSLLMQVGGVHSSRELSDAGFRQLMMTFERLGFQSTNSAANFGRRMGFANAGQVILIRRLWRDYAGGEARSSDLDKWLHGTFGVSAIRFLRADLAPKAIAALRLMVARRQSEGSPRNAA